jgi:hypothetical protein
MGVHNEQVDGIASYIEYPKPHKNTVLGEPGL